MSKKIFSSIFLSFFIVSTVFAQTPNDSFISSQWYLDQIKAYSAWDQETGSEQVVVAVLDTGVDLDHPDLIEQIWTNKSEVAGDGIDNDHNGYIDDVNGWDFVQGDASPLPEVRGGSFDVDAVSHGTFVAGIIGATSDNNEGIAGLNWRIQIMPIRILDRLGSGSSFDATKAVEYAVANGADVINFSLVGNDFDPSFWRAVKEAYEAGVIMVAAVGNESANLNKTPFYPACFKSEDGVEDYVIGVSATDSEDKWATFSNYGSNCADIAAPGVSIYSTLYQSDEVRDLDDYYGGDWDGTSVAAPMVSGAAALLRAAYPGITPEQVKIVLQLAVDPVLEKGSEAAGQLGSGRLNLSRALELGASFASPASATTVKNSSGLLAVAPAGDSSLIRLVDSAGNLRSEFYAFDPDFDGGVRVAVGDVDGDGVDEVVAGAGPGGGPQVRVFEIDGSLVGQFFAYGSSTTHGIFVGVGDLDGDGVDEILTSPDAGGNGEVRWFELNSEQDGFVKPFGNSSASLRVAAGDVDGDGRDELIVGTGPGGRPTVLLFDGNGTFLYSFDAYATTYDRGIYVEAGDLDGDGKDEIVTGTDYGGGPHVRAFKSTGALVSTFFAYDENFRGGVRIALADLDNNGTAEIYTAAGPGGGPHVRVFNASGSAIGGFFPFSDSLKDGIFIAGW